MINIKKVLLIITGSIASYKTLYLIRLLKRENVEVNCVMTESAKKFITPLSVSSLSGRKVYEDIFNLTDEIEMGHIKMAKDNDAIIVAPSSANIISKMANGIADDLATNIILATTKPVFIFPAMNINMWQNSIIKKNINILKGIGHFVFDTVEGNLACGDEGYGRLMEPEIIIEHLKAHFSNIKSTKLKGIKALVTAGPTLEPIDPVRFISNKSSGKQGYSFAQELANLGAEVSLVSGPTDLKKPEKIKKFYQVETAEEMFNACMKNLPKDLFVSVAAVTDWQVKNKAKSKIKKTKSVPSILLKQNPDILKSISTHQKRPKLVVGFAAETNSLINNAKVKIKEKECDILIANNVSEKRKVFGSDINSVDIFDKNGFITKYNKLNKSEISKKVLSEIIYPRLR